MALLSEQPLVSVLIPVRNEGAFLLETLQGVLSQDYPNLEIWVIDGDSTDRTPDIVRETAAQDSRVHLLHNPGRWQSRALNVGLAAAQGEIIVRVDGHTLLAPDYIRHAVYFLSRGEADNVGGIQRAVGKTPMGAAIALALRSRFAVPSAYRTAEQNQYVDTVFMGAWRRELFERVGGWDESYAINEDYNHNYRIRQAGGRILLAMEMKSTYYCRDSLRALWRQHFRYGQGKIKMLREYPGSLRPRQAVAPLFVVTLLGGVVGGLLFLPLGYLSLAVAAAYLLVNVAVSLRLAHGNIGILWRLPLIFAIIHLSWGLGFWGGILHQPTPPTAPPPSPA